MSVLYIVPTPIGNLNDMVPRAVTTLQHVDIIAAEDTRHSAYLFKHFNITAPAQAYHEHNEAQMTPQLIDKLKQGLSVALISDAGTPLVSDPGYKLVRAAHDASIKVVPIPGAVAAMAALSASGLPSDSFSFEGFLPQKSSRRVAALESLKAETRTLIFYESTHRITDMVSDLAEVFGANRDACVCREISKQYETIKKAPLAELLEWMSEDTDQQRGEFVVLVAGASKQSDNIEIDPFQLVEKLAAVLPPNKAAAFVADISDQSKRTLYQFLMDQK